MTRRVLPFNTSMIDIRAIRERRQKAVIISPDETAGFSVDDLVWIETPAGDIGPLTITNIFVMPTGPAIVSIET